LSSEKDSKYIILVGSEKGNTFEFAKFLSTQILSFGEKVIIKPLNSYKIYNQAETLIILTSTYGEGDPPSNANDFVSRFKKFNQPYKIKYSIIGFGSLKYPKFCAFATKIDRMIRPLDNFEKIVPLMKVNRRSVEEFNKWIKMWNSSKLTKIKFNEMEIET
jgi:sulfite reductase (NADPH) flavoprotein alpha-component